MLRWQLLTSQAVLALVCVASAAAQTQPTLRTFCASGTVRGEDGTEMQIVGGQILGGVPMMWISTKDVNVKQVEIDPSTFKLAQSFAEGNTSTAVVNTVDGTEIVFKEVEFLFPEPKSVAGGRKEMQFPMFTLFSPSLGATWKGDAIAGGVIADRSIQVSSVWPDTATVQYPTGSDEHLYSISRFFASTRSGELSLRSKVTFEQLTPREPVSFDISGTQYRMQTIVFAQGPASLEGTQRGDQLEKVEVALELAKRMRWSLQATDDSKTIRYLSELRFGSVAERCAVYEGGVILPHVAASGMRELLDRQGELALRVLHRCFPATAPAEAPDFQGTGTEPTSASMSEPSARAAPSQKTERGPQHSSVSESVAPPTVVEAIETTIAVSMKPFSFFGPCPISERLQALIDKYDAGMVFGVAQAGYGAVKKDKGIAIELSDTWVMPLVFKSEKLPEVKFRRGKIGVVDAEIFVAEGTEVLINGVLLQFSCRKNGLPEPETPKSPGVHVARASGNPSADPAYGPPYRPSPTRCARTGRATADRVPSRRP